MRSRLTFLAMFSLVATQSAFPQAATETALANAHAAGTSSKLTKMYTDLGKTTTGKVTQSVKPAAPATHAVQTSSQRGAVASKASASKNVSKKPPVRAAQAKASAPATPRPSGEGPRIVSILGGEQQ